MEKDISYAKAAADTKIRELMERTETISTEMEAGYTELEAVMDISEGDFIKEMKADLKSEHKAVEEVCNFYKELLKMMEKAAADFSKLDKDYSNEKVGE